MIRRGKRKISTNQVFILIFCFHSSCLAALRRNKRLSREEMKKLLHRMEKRYCLRAARNSFWNAAGARRLLTEPRGSLRRALLLFSTPPPLLFLSPRSCAHRLHPRSLALAFSFTLSLPLSLSLGAFYFFSFRSPYSRSKTYQWKKKITSAQTRLLCKWRLDM